MVLKVKVLGRAALTKRIQQLAPSAMKAMDKAKLEVANEAAAKIAARAPKDTGDYAESIRGGLQSDNPNNESFGHRKSKDPTAVGVYGNFRWKFLEFGTKASAGEASRVDKRYKAGDVMAKGKGPHAATPAQPHVFPTWRGMRPAAMRKIRRALNKGIRQAMGK